MRWTSSGSNKYIDKELWHDWFAWFPVCIRNHGGGHKEMVWFEKIKRKGKYTSIQYGWDFKYKL